MSKPNFKIASPAKLQMAGDKMREFEKMSLRLAEAHHKAREAWMKSVAHRVLPNSIYRAVTRDGINCSQFVKNWLARHVRLHELPGGEVHYILDGKIVGRARFTISARGGVTLN